jgi:hypothetical protein
MKPATKAVPAPTVTAASPTASSTTAATIISEGEGLPEEPILQPVCIYNCQH